MISRINEVIALEFSVTQKTNRSAAEVTSNDESLRVDNELNSQEQITHTRRMKNLISHRRDNTSDAFYEPLAFSGSFFAGLHEVKRSSSSAIRWIANLEG